MSSESDPDFQVFVHRAVPMTSQPFVTVQKRGMLSVNTPAYRLLGSPEAVELMYDPHRRIIGMRGVDPSAAHAYPLRALSGRDAGPFVVSATAFLKHFGITQTVSRRWSAAVRGGVLQVDLGTEGTPVSSNRTGPAGASPDRWWTRTPRSATATSVQADAVTRCSETTRLST